MNAIITTVIICIVVAIILAIYFRRSNIRDNGSPINKARDNNKRSEDINRQASVTLEKLRGENNEAGRLNEDIGEANKTAGDIIAEVRKQRID